MIKGMRTVRRVEVGLGNLDKDYGPVGMYEGDDSGTEGGLGWVRGVGGHQQEGGLEYTLRVAYCMPVLGEEDP